MCDNTCKVLFFEGFLIYTMHTHAGGWLTIALCPYQLYSALFYVSFHLLISVHGMGITRMPWHHEQKSAALLTGAHFPHRRVL